MTNFKIRKVSIFVLPSLLMSPPFLALAITGGIPIPLAPTSTLHEFLGKVVDVALQIGVFFAIFMIIYAGFRFVTAQGNKEQIETAKKIFFWTVIGVLVLLGAKVISEIITNTVDQIKK